MGKSRSRTKPKPRAGRVCLGWVDDETLHSGFVDSLLNIVTTRAELIGGRVRVGSGANISKARNLLVRGFLEATDDEWLWMLDTDLVLPGDALDRLLEFADPIERPIVSGLYYASEHWETLPPGMTGQRPLIFHLDGEQLFTTVRAFEHGARFQVGGLPTGCLLVHRSVYEKLDTSLFPWFYEQVIDEHWVSEDLTFSLIAQSAGYPLWIDTGVACEHIKPTRLSSASYAALGGPITAPKDATE